MPRPRRDGTPSSGPQKAKLSELLIRNLQPREDVYRIYDLRQSGLSIQIQPTGRKAWKCIYSVSDRRRWYSIGSVDAIGLADARKLAREVLYKVDLGADPCEERKIARGSNTFEEVAKRYIEECAKCRNRSWRQSEKLIRHHLMPRWCKLQVDAITRLDARTAFRSIAAPMVANQTFAAASTIFSWDI